MAGRSPEAEIAEALAEDTRQGRVKWQRRFVRCGPISAAFTYAWWRGMIVEVAWRSGFKPGEPRYQCLRLAIGDPDECARYRNPAVAELVGRRRIGAME